jgi:hypothetical protein
MLDLVSSRDRREHNSPQILFRSLPRCGRSRKGKAVSHTTPPPKNNAGLLSLLGNPQALNAAIEDERRAKVPPPGWLGIQPLVRCSNYQLCLKLGDGVVQIEVDRRSAAYRRGGLRTEDFLKSVQVDGAPEISLDEFMLTPPPPVGTRIIFRFYRPGTGKTSKLMLTDATLTAPPKEPGRTEHDPTGRRPRPAPRHASRRLASSRRRS